MVECLLNYGIVHRNINLRNIYVDTATHQIKVGDFLLVAKNRPIYKPHSETSSYHFFAPEIWLEENQGVEAPADIWSLGVLLYALTCGCYPFGGKHELDIFLNVKRARFSIPHFLSEQCAALIRSLLNPNPSERPTIAAVKSHPWITGINTSLLIVGPSHNSNGDENLESGSDMYTLDSSPSQEGYFLPVEQFSPMITMSPGSPTMATSNNRNISPSISPTHSLSPIHSPPSVSKKISSRSL